jgi:hypothetical protein
MASEGSHDTNIIINNTLLTGIQNVSFQQNYNEEPLSLLGNAYASTQIQGPPTTTAKIDKLLLNRDFITGLTGSTGIFGSFVYGDNAIQFNRAVLDGYSLSVGIGSDPEISFDFTVHGDMSGIQPNLVLYTTPVVPSDLVSAATPDNAIAEINQTGISVELNTSDNPQIGNVGVVANAVQSFTFTETYQYQPKYKIGDHKPCQMDLIKPIQQSATFSMEVEDYAIQNRYNHLQGISEGGLVDGAFNDFAYRNTKIVKLTLTTKNGDKNVFELQNAYLSSETISQGVGDTIVANLTFRGHKT